MFSFNIFVHTGCVLMKFAMEIIINTHKMKYWKLIIMSEKDIS